MRIRLGTRGSPLARWQAEWVAARLSERGVQVELVLITTQGDRQQSGPISEISGQGVFTKEIQRAVLDGRADLAVHSLKDLPTAPVDGLALAAVPPRESPGDALVLRSDGTLADLPANARVGTGSLRRRAQLLYARGDLHMLDIRGNVDTRLRKLDGGEFDALVLAEAGLRRLGLEGRIAEVLPYATMLPAVGQGALGLETRADDRATREAVAALDDPATHAAVLAERALLAALRGGCLAPVGAWGRVVGDLLRLDAAVLSSDGRKRLLASDACDVTEFEHAPAVALGQSVAQQLIAQGADEMIDAARGG